VRKILKFLILLLIPLSVGAVSGFFTVSEVKSWYDLLNKPSWNPPRYLFGPVWTTLYLLMGYSCFRISEARRSKTRTLALQLFGLQLFVNFWWSILFFHFHLIGTALVEIIILWILILAMIIQFRKVDPPAAWLNIPYLLWVSFASVLTATIYYLN
jgi:tryptophan-rich sensory protein